MSRTYPLLLAVAVLALTLAVGCGLTVTNERPTYDELTEKEQDAVDIVLAELRALDKNIRILSRNPKTNISGIIDKNKIHVSFEGVIFVANIGNDVIHVATWENLTADQKELVKKWWNAPDLAAAEKWYKFFFYRFMAVAQGVKQYMYNVLTPSWVFANRSVFNMERDSIRTAMSHFVAEGRRTQMWNFATQLCRPVLQQYAKDYPGTFPNIKASKRYLNEHITELADPDNPTGYMYFICEWIELGRKDAGTLQEELDWLRDLPLP